jgi:hypothetical protein
MIEEAKIVQNRDGESLNSFRAAVDHLQRTTREICIWEGPGFTKFMLDKYQDQMHHLYTNFQRGSKKFRLGEIYRLLVVLQGLP